MALTRPTALELTHAGRAGRQAIPSDCRSIWMVDYDASTVQKIHLRLYGGDDNLTVQPETSHNIHAYAGAGNDRVLSGAGSDWLVGGADDDFIAGREGRDMIDVQGVIIDRIKFWLEK